MTFGIIYLSNLRHISGQPVLFHRLGSLNAVDIYEIMTLDGKFWDILYLDFYHPRKSRSVPEGYSAAFDWTATFYGTNEFVEDFPKNIHIAVGQTFERLIGIRMCLPEIREAVEGKEFLRPSEHARRSASLRREIAKHQSVNEYNLSPSAPSPSSPKPEPVADADEEMTVVSLAEGQERFAREIEALFLRVDQKLVLVQSTQYSRNLTASCQNRAGLFKLSAHGKPETPALDDDFAIAVERPHV